MKKKPRKKSHRIEDSLLIDATRLRTALWLACLKITDGDLIAAIDLSEELYDSAPQFLEQLASGGTQDLPVPDVTPYIRDFDIGSHLWN
jgi:hypothetical protein